MYKTGLTTTHFIPSIYKGKGGLIKVLWTLARCAIRGRHQDFLWDFMAACNIWLKQDILPHFMILINDKMKAPITWDESTMNTFSSSLDFQVVYVLFLLPDIQMKRWCLLDKSLYESVMCFFYWALIVSIYFYLWNVASKQSLNKTLLHRDIYNSTLQKLSIPRV